MENILNIICPISNEKINENVARIAAVITIIVTAVSIYLNSFVLIALLAIDFALRSYSRKGNSPIKFVSKQIVAFLKIKNKPTDSAAKRFAAEVGFIFSTAVCVSQITGNYLTADIVGGILIFFAVLESAFNFCMGCFVYTYLVLPLLKKNDRTIHKG